MARRLAKRSDSPRKKRGGARLEVDARRAQLIELGLAHFGKRSYDDVSIDAIAEAAGISKGLLYHYFPTKRAFYAAAVREASQRLLAATDIAEDGRPPLEQLEAGIDAYLDFVEEHGPAYLNLMSVGTTGGGDAEILAIVDEARSEFLARITDGLAESAIGMPLRQPFARIALKGWIGFVETATLAWLQERKAASRRAVRKQLRELLVAALLGILQTDAVRS